MQYSLISGGAMGGGGIGVALIFRDSHKNGKRLVSREGYARSSAFVK